MGSIVYDFLSESILFHKPSFGTGFQNEEANRLEKELQDYREFLIRNFDAITAEIIEMPSRLKIFSTLEVPSVKMLTQTALYLDQVIISDPLLKFSDSSIHGSNTTARFLGLPETKFDKNKLAQSCKYLSKITPFIAGDYVKIFGASLFFERPNVPLYAPDHFFKGHMPPEILNFFLEKVEIHPIIKAADGKWIITNDTPTIGRAIAVDFEGSESSGGMVYFLTESETIEVNKETGKIVTRETFPESPPNEATWRFWINQCMHSASVNYFNQVTLENQIAAALRASYLTDNTFTSQLLDLQMQNADSIQLFTANQMLNFELPFLDRVDVDKLMDVRVNDADVFTSFRVELEKGFRELRTITDQEQLRKKAENIIHELNDVQGQKIRRKIEHLNKQMFIDGIIGFGGLVASFVSGFSFLATLMATIKGYKDVREYREKVIENPAYFLWKVQSRK